MTDEQEKPPAATDDVVRRLVNKTGITKTKADMAAVQQALEEYKNQHGGRYPSVGALNTGFAMLGRELYGMYGDGLTGVPPNMSPDPNDPPAWNGSATYLQVSPVLDSDLAP